MWPEPVSELEQVPVRTHADFFHNLADFPKIYNMCLRTRGKQPINSSSPHRPARFNLSAQYAAGFRNGKFGTIELSPERGDDRCLEQISGADSNRAADTL
jgi:hypothetical protein